MGREGPLALSGDVRTTMFGADYAKGPLMVGLSLANSRGLGNYGDVDSERVASSVTGLYPWLGYKATDRVTVWGVAGYGAGRVMLTPAGAPALESGLSMAMAAGVRIPVKSITHSDGNRSPIPTEIDHPFRRKSITHSDGAGGGASSGAAFSGSRSSRPRRSA